MASDLLASSVLAPAADEQAVLRRAPRMAAVALVALGALVLFGWAFDLPQLTHLRPDWAGMAPPTALVFMLLGGSLWLRSGRAQATGRGIQRELAALPLVLAIAWLGVHALGWAYSWGPPLALVSGAEVAPITALAFAFLAAALLTSERPSPAVPQALALCGAITGGAGAMRYVYHSPIPLFAPMALHTAVGMMVGAAAILAMRPDASLLRSLRDPGPGGVMARRLLPLALATPLCSGWMLLNVSIDVRAHVHVLAPMNALVFGGLVWWAAGVLRRSDEVRSAAETARLAEQAVRLVAEEARAAEHEVRKAAELARDAEQERFLILTRATLDTVWDWDAHQETLWLSDNFPKTFGWEVPERPTRQWMRDRLHPEDLPRMVREIAQAQSAGRELWSLELRFRHADGGYRHVLARGVVLRERTGALHRIIGTMLDIGDRIAIEEALRERTAALERSNTELERFAQIASHDLQEPLRTVSSFVQLIAKRYGELLDDNGRRYVHYVVDGAARMRTLIDALLAYSRVERPNAPITGEVELGKVMARARADLRTAIAESQAEVTSDELPVVQGNEIQLTQVLMNLVGNAIKYRGSEAPRVHVGATREEAGWRISVADNGIGIDPQYFERIFVMFQRLHTREAYEGTGVGLALCKRIVERHGGRIWLESSPGAGCTFHFTLKPTDGGAHADPLS
jgi:PAS domain S-box-containing protein